jgi:hypothetical protein
MPGVKLSSHQRLTSPAGSLHQVVAPALRGRLMNGAYLRIDIIWLAVAMWYNLYI